MCGIFGVYSKHEILADRVGSIIRNSWESLRLRGPDGRGALIYSSDIGAKYLGESSSLISNKASLILTHTRLSVIDILDRSRQPMCDSGGKFWLIYNGEIYNFTEIRVRLQKEFGVLFTTESDSEVIVEAWKVWGESCVELFEGMFAFAIFDILKKELYLVRDRVGIKPLYYSEADDYIVFASDQTTLLQSGLVEAKPNWTGVVAGMQFRGSLRPITVYEGIYEVKPASIAKVNRANFSVIQKEYWDLRNEDTQGVLSDSRIVAKSKEMLQKIVGSYLVSDIPVATLMSGGVDSSLMTILANHAQSNIAAYTLAWDDVVMAEGSEVDNAKRIANLHKLNHNVTTFSLGNNVKNFIEMQDVFEEPMGLLEPHFPIAESIAANGYKVLLNGLGPDELFAGYSYYKLINKISFLKKIKNILNIIPSLNDRINLVKKISKCEHIADVFLNLFSGYTWRSPKDIFLPQILNNTEPPFELARRLFPRAWDKLSDPFKIFSYLDLKIYIGTHHNHTADRFLMNKSIEGRFPYLNHEWLEYSFGLPNKHKMKGGVQKVLIKKIAEEFLPGDIVYAQKKGFNIPQIEFLKTREFSDYCRDMLTDLSKRHVVIPDVINFHIQHDPESNRHANQKLYLVSLEYWLKKIEGYTYEPL